MSEGKMMVLKGRRPNNPTSRLRTLMQARGLSSRLVADTLRCNRNHLNKILAGRVQPRRELALRLAGILGCDPRDLWWPQAENLPFET
jgi:transcriptional regulator with XRE-family HTH domain